ncbi:alkaline phosphatase [Dyadobacter bucti]|uniref:alkaline phosphatase n=1 Tax=Dyadobacter bucti TaxID=2572203 RepID=UPI001E2D12FB|nr:alkaline phosphatase [Dyadobacter bucti]
MKIGTSMRRREFFRNSSLTVLGTSLLLPFQSSGATDRSDRRKGNSKTAKNIIFMVSDGMSTSTLNMASLLTQRQEGRIGHWMQLYTDNKAQRALMDTASADSVVTDSAASSSAWGGGVRVNNGSLNANPDGTLNKPILQKFKAAGKSVGCVTTVPITHATPAGFCISNSSRGDQGEIAMQYLPLKFDVMMGGGAKYFSADSREDKTDLFKSFADNGYQVVRNKEAMMNVPAQGSQPLLGIFGKDALPYTLDQLHDATLKKEVPTLAEMTRKAIEKLNTNKKGFVMQVEGGKVDWAAHSNDTVAALYDQVAFDDAIKVAIDFAEKDKETLVIITTDHGNGNPGLFGGTLNSRNFDYLHTAKHTNDWVLNGLNRDSTAAQIIERLEAAQGYAIKKEEAERLQKYYTTLNQEGLYNPKKLPFKELALIQSAYTYINWSGMDHSSDYVELAMFGPGSEWLKPFVRNTELHQFMLNVTDVKTAS